MDRAHGALGVFLVDEDRELDLARGDHVDVDVRRVERLKHLGGNAGVSLHACAHDGDLCNVGVDIDVIELEAVAVRVQNLLAARCVLVCDGEDDSIAYPPLNNSR